MNEHADQAWQKFCDVFPNVDLQNVESAFDIVWRARGEADKAAAQTAVVNTAIRVAVDYAIAALDEPFED